MYNTRGATGADATGLGLPPSYLAIAGPISARE